jgi:hypothetical protein
VVPVRHNQVKVVDYLGDTRTLTAKRRHVALDAGPGPQYLVDG